MVEAATYEELMAPFVDPAWPAASYPDLSYPSAETSARPLRSDAIIRGLSESEMEAARDEGLWRYEHAKRKGSAQRYGAGDRYATDEERIELDVQAAGAELAVARHFDWRWSGFHHAEPYDVEGVLEVRFRRDDPEHPDRLDLWIRPSDVREKPGPYVLVTGEFPVYIIRGWAKVPDDCRPEFLVEHVTRPGSKAYVFPRAALRSLRALPGRKR